LSYRIEIVRNIPASELRHIQLCWRHPTSGYAVVGVATAVRLQGDVVAEATIGVTGAAGHAFAGDAATKFLIGKRLSLEVIAEAARLLGETTECLSDRYASAEYRAGLVATETKRALLSLAE
jgi:aerobic carbon-monoxide dehydrogenase medium subunit